MRGFRQACLHFPRSVSDVANLDRILEIPRAPSTVTTFDLMWIFTCQRSVCKLEAKFLGSIGSPPSGTVSDSFECMYLILTGWGEEV